MTRRVLFYVLYLFILSGVCHSQNVSKEALFWDKLEDNTVQCRLCPRRCVIPQGMRGYCGVRVNRNGKLFTLAYNNPVAVAIDPIEKKPFFHVLPGTGALSIAVAGCNLRCIFCQNWNVSQKRPDETINYNITPQGIVDLAKKYEVPSIVFTYTEPTVFYEYMLDIAKLAKKSGLHVGMHTCGYINPEPLRKLLKYMDFVDVDLKSFSDKFYQELGNGAHLAPILKTLKTIKESGTHLEITTLVIPGKNDSEKEIHAMCEWIRDNLGADTVLSFSRFFPQFKLKNIPPTPIETLKKAYSIAKTVGLKYVYIGNVPGIKEESTFCPHCGKVLIKRFGYSILENNIVGGRCKFCGTKIEGVWK